jgi:hypothetical protein
MRTRIYTLCLLFLCSSSLATSIKGRATVYTPQKHKPFAVLYDGTSILQSSDKRRNQIWVELHCFVSKTDYEKGKLATRTIQFDYDSKGKSSWPVDQIFLTDTVYLYSDDALQHLIGHAWPATDSLSISIDDRDKSPKYLRCWLYGHVDSSAIAQFNPWNKVILTVDSSSNLFKISYAQLKGHMRSINNYCTEISGKGLEYSETYDEDTPTPGIALVYVFRDGILKALWTEVKLAKKNMLKFERGYLYYDDSLKSLLPTLKKEIKGRLDYTS